MRVYLPATLTALAEVLRTGEVGPAPVRGYAVTPALREWYSSGDLEELEYIALLHAARSSLRLVSADPAAPPRRVVLAAEIPADRPGVHAAVDGDGDDPALVRIDEPIGLRDVVSGHVDDPAAAQEIAAAAAALIAADAGDDDAQFIVDGAEGHELQWYATQELSDLLAP